jgi:predicted membrane protein
LKIGLPSDKRVIPVKGEDNRWTVHLADDVPMDLDVKLGIGEGEIKPAGLALRSLDVEMGVGEVEIDLTGGTWERNFDVRIHGGIGEAGVRVPNDVGVVVTASGGIGEINVQGMHRDGDRWVNDVYGESPVTISVEAKGGIGEIWVTTGG